MRWTTRLKRYGGKRAIEQARVRQYGRLVKIDSDLARMATAFLDGNPLRVLSPLTEEALGWRK
jgi:hypothetical protein